MPYTKLKIREGFYTEDTRVDSAGRWINGDHIRFVTDVPEKIGGWSKFVSTQFLGICRSIIAWPTFQGLSLSAFGTNLKLYAIFDGSYWDITPYLNDGILENPFSTTSSSTIVTVTQPNHGLVSTDKVLFQNVTSFANITINGIYSISNITTNTYDITVSTPANATTTGGGFLVLFAFIKTLTNPFTTLNGSSLVNVTQSNHGCVVGQYITFSNATPLGGIDPNGTWTVSEVINSNNFLFDVGTLATSTVGPGGGTVNYLYELQPGADNTTIGFGYGVSTYGRSTYGTARSDSGIVYDYPRIWSLDIWSDDLVACPRDGGIYYWPHANSAPVTNRAALIPNAPAQSKVISIWPDAQILIAFGCTDTDGNYNPMNIRWCTVGDYTVWTPATTNTAGQQALTDGNQILGVVKMRGQMLIATDTALYSMYGDLDTTFAFRGVGNAKVLSPNSMVQVNGVVYFMGEKQFYVYDGTLHVIPCEVRRHVFENINLQQAFKVFGSINSQFNEVWWFYPSAQYDSNGNPTNFENDSYVIYNFQKNIWYFGTMDRTAFLDAGELGLYPLAASATRYLYYQEFGVNADGNGLGFFLESGDMIIDNRNRFVYVKNIIPDLLETNKNINFTFTTRRFPQDPGVRSIEYVVTPTTDVIGVRVKGGQVSFTYQSDEIDSIFQVGDLEVQYLPTGVK